jgi:hypothetical protein
VRHSRLQSRLPMQLSKSHASVTQLELEGCRE